MGLTSYLTVGGEILSETRNGVESDYVPYPIGSTALLLNSSQTITDAFTWWPYGEQRSHTIGTSVTPFGYIGTLGYYTDSVSARLYIRTRSLRPSLTRWQSTDPLWPNETPYAYVGCSPSNFVDPTGWQVEYPPVPPPRMDPPNSKPHYMHDRKCCCYGTHTHGWEYNQLPFPSCKCFLKPEDDGICYGLCVPGPCVR